MICTNLRQEVRAVLGEKCFIRRDRSGSALFVSDFPRRGGDQAKIAKLIDVGWDIRKADGMLYLNLGEKRRIRLIESLQAIDSVPYSDEHLPLYSLALRLMRTDTPPEMQSPEAIRVCLLLTDAKDEAKLYETMSTMLSEMLRNKLPLPSAAGRIIAQYLTEADHADQVSRTL